MDSASAEVQCQGIVDGSDYILWQRAAVWNPDLTYVETADVLAGQPALVRWELINNSDKRMNVLIVNELPIMDSMSWMASPTSWPGFNFNSNPLY